MCRTEGSSSCGFSADGRSGTTMQRHDHDVLIFYGWLATIEPALIPSEPGSYRKLRTLLRDHLLSA